MDWLDYREALGIGFSDPDKVRYFVTIVFNFLESASDFIRSNINQDEYFMFCNTTGTSFVQNMGFIRMGADNLPVFRHLKALFCAGMGF